MSPISSSDDVSGVEGMGVGRTGPGPILHPSLMGTKPTDGAGVGGEAPFGVGRGGLLHQLEILADHDGSADPHQPGLETDIGPAQSAEHLAGRRGGGQSERGGELGVVVEGIDEPLPSRPATG